MSKKKETIPRYVLKFQDNLTGATLAVGSDDPLDFWKPLPDKHRQPGVGNEVQRVFKAFMRMSRALEGKQFPASGQLVDPPKGEENEPTPKA